jgi:hypothetical protein
MLASCVVFLCHETWISKETESRIPWLVNVVINVPASLNMSQTVKIHLPEQIFKIYHENPQYFGEIAPPFRNLGDTFARHGKNFCQNLLIT